MKLLKFLFFIAVLFTLFSVFMSIKYRNPYKLTMIFGKKGAGKTTLLTKLAIKYRKMGYPVFSNVEIFGTEKLDIKDIGVKRFPINSVLLIDEASLIWDNRNFKSFKVDTVGRYFRLMRHEKNICYLCSQTFDVDLKLRNMCDNLYLLTNFMGWLSVARRIKKTPTLHQPETDDSGSSKQEGFITEDFRFDLPSTWIWTYIPRYIKFFNSFEVDKMDPVNRFRYKFYNEEYLQKLTNWKYYKLDQIKDLKNKISKLIHELKLSVLINEKEYMSYIYCYPAFNRFHVVKTGENG